MQHKDTLIVGLTGQTGAGKTTVAKLFSERGAAVIDADVIARETLDSSIECLADLVLEYSTEIITPEGTLNRKKLAKLCFSDKERLRRLNEITYPHIIRNIEDKMNEVCVDGLSFLVLDAPTLYEAGLQARCDTVAAVLADEEVRCQRIMARDGLTEEEARTRIGAQKKDEFYISRADHILKNNEDEDALHLAFIELWGCLEAQLRDKGAASQPKEEAAETPQKETGDA